MTSGRTTRRATRVPWVYGVRLRATSDLRASRIDSVTLLPQRHRAGYPICAATTKAAERTYTPGGRAASEQCPFANLLARMIALPLNLRLVELLHRLGVFTRFVNELVVADHEPGESSRPGGRQSAAEWISTSMLLDQIARRRRTWYPVLRVEGVVRGLDLAVEDRVVVIMKWGITPGEQDAPR